MAHKQVQLPHALAGLNETEAITDALTRAIIAFDTHDLDIFKSAFVESDSTIFDLSGKVSNGYKAIKEEVFDFVGPLDTTHFISNVRVDLKDVKDGKAQMTAYALAQHFFPGEGTKSDVKNFLAGSTYALDLVKEGELWKIKDFKMIVAWTQGDWSVMQPTSGKSEA